MIGKHYDYIYRGIRIDLTGYSPPTVSLTRRSNMRSKASSRRPVGQDAAGHIDEAIVTLERWKAMLDEDGEK